MKKTILSLLVILAAAAGTAFAAETLPTEGTSIGSQGFKTSNKVTIIVSSVAGTSTNPGGFSAASYHDSGNRNFAVNSVEPKIFWKDKVDNAGVAESEVDASASPMTPAISGWNSL